jgi:hypothetical protein
MDFERNTQLQSHGAPGSSTSQRGSIRPRQHVASCQSSHLRIGEMKEVTVPEFSDTII